MSGSGTDGPITIGDGTAIIRGTGTTDRCTTLITPTTTTTILLQGILRENIRTGQLLSRITAAAVRYRAEVNQSDLQGK